MSDAAANREDSPLLRQLARLDRRARLVALLNGLGVSALVLTGTVVVAVLADALFDLPLSARLGLLSVAGAVVLLGCVWSVMRALWRRFDPAAAAALVEAAYPQLQERLSSAVELESAGGAGGSALMRALVVRQAEQGLSRLDLATPLPVAQATRRGALGGAALAALLAPCVFFGGYRVMLARFATPWRNLERVANLSFEVTPGDAAVSRGADVEIAAAPQWRFTRTEIAAALLRWTDAAGQRFERQMIWQPDRSTFTATVTDVLQPFDFEIVSGRTRTRRFHIDVVDRPWLTAVSATIEPPAYSGRAVQHLEGVVGELELLRGSRLTLQMQFNLPAQRASLKWMPDPTEGAPATESELAAQLSADRLAADVELQPESSGRFALQLFDPLGLANRHEPQRRVRLIADAPPEVRFADRAAASQAGPHDVLRLPVVADDDIGLAELELHYEIVGQPQSAAHLDAEIPLLGLRSAAHEFELDLKPLNLLEGAIVSVRARAADERPDPGPNESWTEPRLITISTQADAFGSEALAERQRELSQTLQRLRAAVAQNREKTIELRSHAEAQQQTGSPFERAADVAAVAEADRETAAQAERLAAMFELHPLLQSLGERTRSVGSKQLTPAADSSARAVGAPQAERSGLLTAAADQLQQAETELVAIQRDLESLAELEQDLLELQRLADDAERLAEEVAGLQSNDSPNEDSPPAPETPEAKLRALAADRLRIDHADLTQRLDNLLNRRPELLDAAAEHALDHVAQLRQQAQQLAERERRLATALQEEPAPQPPTVEETERLQAIAAQQAELAEHALQAALAAAESPQNDARLPAAAAERAQQAADAAARGELAEAAVAARQAAERAAENAATPDAADRSAWQEFAARQQSTADRLAAAAESAESRAAARQQNQQQMSAAAGELAREFSQLAEELTADPLGRTAEGARASNSSAAAQQAQGLMDTAAAAQSAAQTAEAAAAAEQAAAQLDVAAENAAAAAEQTPDSPVPTEVGQQVAQASRQLRRAGAELGNVPRAEGLPDSAEEGQAAADDAAAGQPQAAQEQGPMSDAAQGEGPADVDGQPSENADSASELARAAAALQQAAQRLKPRAPGEQESLSETAPGQQPGANPQSDSATEGGGTSETPRLTDLASKIKARAMRNWGELPGELRSELQQRTQSRPDADYAPLIRMYFDEISRRRSPTAEEVP